MPYAMITEEEVQAFVRAKNASNRKAATKQVWAGIRARLDGAVPPNAKLGVETDPSEPHYAKVYVKGSYPRQYLTVADAVPTATSGGFTVLGGQTDESTYCWYRVNKHNLLELLRGEEPGDVVAQLPSGFPSTSSDDAVVLDGANGSLYYRDLKPRFV